MQHAIESDEHEPGSCVTWLCLAGWLMWWLGPAQPHGPHERKSDCVARRQPRLQSHLFSVSTTLEVQFQRKLMTQRLNSRTHRPHGEFDHFDGWHSSPLGSPIKTDPFFHLSQTLCALYNVCAVCYNRHNWTDHGPSPATSTLGEYMLSCLWYRFLSLSFDDWASYMLWTM